MAAGPTAHRRSFGGGRDASPAASNELDQQPDSPDWGSGVDSVDDDDYDDDTADDALTARGCIDGCTSLEEVAHALEQQARHLRHLAHEGFTMLPISTAVVPCSHVHVTRLLGDGRSLRVSHGRLGLGVHSSLAARLMAVHCGVS